MTYAQTNELIKALDQIETWASAIARGHAKESIDYDRMATLEKYLQDAKEAAFNIANK